MKASSKKHKSNVFALATTTRLWTCKWMLGQVKMILFSCHTTFSPNAYKSQDNRNAGNGIKITVHKDGFYQLEELLFDGMEINEPTYDLRYRVGSQEDD